MMNKWRRVAVTTVALVTTVATTQASNGPVLASEAGPSGGQPALAAVSPEQDGRTLFEGVYFLTGPAGAVAAEAMRVPDLMVETNQSPEAAAYLDALLERVAELDPTFFASFSTDLRSGNPFTVEQALAAGQQLIDQANQGMTTEASEFTQSRSQDETHAFPLFLVAVAVVAVAVASVAVGGNIAVVVEVVAAGAPANGSNELAREQAISALTEAYAR